MPDIRRVKCQTCKRHKDEVGEISWRGNCAACGTRLLRENVVALMEHSGPEFLRWRRASAAAVGAVLIDDLQALQ